MVRGLYLQRIISILLFFFVACGSDKSDVKPQFYYYPNKNVYYDSLKKNFWFSLNGGKSWNRFTDSTGSEPKTLGSKVAVYTEDSEVYKNNESHRKLYAGKLYSISVVDTSTSTGPEVAERKVVEEGRATTRKKSAVKKSKKGIGKFLNKIFGKRK
ncbi:hypothetical protein [Segetibacter sp.]|jgi:hypothetical protein|uniref:hypothetical protein n=1 Tax=Segetibacter sp. TaxID=2231182 RepID=UPI00262B8D13|nr:hypothetical protein [Segetibacter sp.]MCW3081413.1 hypothetical protein [Segetibacter sp.]